MSDPQPAAVAIEAIAPGDHDGWMDLWAGYLRFYRQRLPAEITATTFARLIDPGRDPRGLVARQADGTLVGFAHYLSHGSTWSLADVIHLEDLFVDPEARGLGIGRRLIEAVYRIADERGAGGVYWMTQEFNADGRALYDTLARRTSFIRYER
jgi:GNAT superfamily N-acetyltransferase